MRTEHASPMWRPWRLGLPGLWALALVLAVLGPSIRAAELQAPDLLWLDRFSFGLSPQSVADLERLGRKAWLAEQLHPGPEVLPEPVGQRIQALTLSGRPTVEWFDEFLTQRRALRDLTGDEQAQKRRALRDGAHALSDDAIERTLLRAVHSRWQLREVMTWFWFNHFNILAKGDPAQALLAGDYEERAIRSHALGRFRDLLEAVATHPAMLIYLNNDRNVAGRINENYARELMELHTLGVDAGYTQEDVQQLAQVLTGLGVRHEPPPQAPASAVKPAQAAPVRALALTEGMAAFFPNRHAEGERVLLGRTLDAKGWAQIQQALDLLARHPATARHIARRLATYFVADEPPATLVQRLAERFTQTEGDIAALLTTLAESPELEASLDRKFKDPMQFVVSAVRLTLPPQQHLEQPRRLVLWLNLLGQPLWGRRTPDGYPLAGSAWQGSAQLNQRFQVAQLIASGAHMTMPWFAAGEPGLVAGSPFVRQAVVPGLSAGTQGVLLQAQRPAEWRTFLLSSPEFMTR